MMSELYHRSHLTKEQTNFKHRNTDFTDRNQVFTNKNLKTQKSRIKSNQYFVHTLQTTCKQNTRQILKYKKEERILKHKTLRPNCQPQASQGLFQQKLEANSTKLPEDKKKSVRPLSSYLRTFKEKSDSAQQSPTKTMRKQRNYIRSFIPPSNMTAFAYMIYEQPNIVHISWNSQSSVEIASLTKIMTCYAILQIINSNPSLLQQQIIIGAVETNITGTKAGLLKSQIYSVQQLLYGLMLPSGNDASLALAIWGGRKIYGTQIYKSQTDLATQSSTNKPLKKRQSIGVFVEYMNRFAQTINMKKTHYANPHGLSNPLNKSTAFDICKLCSVAMQDPLFCKIVSMQVYEAEIQDINGYVRSIKWNNTHKLLRKPEYLGVKTGMTTTAGACLASCIKTQNQRKFMIVVLNCNRVDRRFKQTDILKRWLLKKQRLRLAATNDQQEDITSNFGDFEEKEQELTD